MSNYFRKLPDLDYPSLLKTKQSNVDYVKTKNLFRRVKVREDLFGNFMQFDKYKIEGDDRPDNVAEKVYGTDEYDWIVLMANNIIDLKNEWPMANNDFNTYVTEKYTHEQLVKVHHYETIEFRSKKNQLIVEGGKEVDVNFKVEYYDGGQMKSVSPLKSVSYFEYETLKNDGKRNINLLKPDLIGLFLKDFNRIMKYDKSSQYVNKGLKKTENIRLK